MSKSHYEENVRLKHQNYSYRTLERTCEYACPQHNKFYPDFHGGINCLCSTKSVRSSMDKFMNQKEQGKVVQWPVSNDRLGWKL